MNELVQIMVICRALGEDEKNTFIMGCLHCRLLPTPKLEREVMEIVKREEAALDKIRMEIKKLV